MTDTATTPDWYQSKVTTVDPDARSLLEEYSGLQPDEVLSHVLALRDEAFKIFPYPCIGQMRFLSCHLARLPFYPRVLARLQAHASAGFLDAGCCVGQELRYLVHRAKIPARSLYGFDLETGFLNLDINFSAMTLRDFQRLCCQRIWGLRILNGNHHRL